MNFAALPCGVVAPPVPAVPAAPVEPPAPVVPPRAFGHRCRRCRPPRRGRGAALPPAPVLPLLPAAPVAPASPERAGRTRGAGAAAARPSRRRRRSSRPSRSCPPRRSCRRCRSFPRRPWCPRLRSFRRALPPVPVPFDPPAQPCVATASTATQASNQKRSGLQAVSLAEGAAAVKTRRGPPSSRRQSGRAGSCGGTRVPADVLESMLPPRQDARFYKEDHNESSNRRHRP